MKLAVTGKGGVGKTTVSALLARELVARGRQVVAIDADPDSNLAGCLGYPHPEAIPLLVELHDLIEERTGVRPGTTGGMFQLNPFVADLAKRANETAPQLEPLGSTPAFPTLSSEKRGVCA